MAFAYFVGSDYTTGVRGVGAFHTNCHRLFALSIKINSRLMSGLVNAMEILCSFPMKKMYGGPMSGLRMFKHWINDYDVRENLTVPMSEDDMLTGFIENAKALSLSLLEEDIDKMVGALELSPNVLIINHSLWIHSHRSHFTELTNPVDRNGLFQRIFPILR